MLHVKTKIRDRRFTIPVPYTLINLSLSILTSRTLHRFVLKCAKGKEDKLVPIFALIDKQALRKIFNELKNHKGTVLVDAKTKDGIHVIVKL